MARSKKQQDHPYTALFALWVEAGIDPRTFFGKEGINPELYFPPKVRQLLGTSRPVDDSNPVELPGPDAPPLVLLTKAEQRQREKAEKQRCQADASVSRFDVIVSNPPFSLAS